MEISVSLYSFSYWLRYQGVTIKDCIEFCGSVKELSAMDIVPYFWKDEENEKANLNRWLSDNGLRLSSYGIGNNFAHADRDILANELKKARDGIDTAAELGAPCLRVFGGSLRPQNKETHDPSWGVSGTTLPENVSKTEALRIVINHLKQVAEYSESKGVMLGLENHGGLPETVDEVQMIMDEVDSPNLKVIVDTGDFFWQGQDPAEAIAVLYPKVIRVQLNEIIGPSRDLKNRDYTRQHPEKEHRAFGQGDMDFRSIIEKLKELEYKSYLTLEVEQRGSYRNPELGADIRQSAEYISEIIESTRAAAK